MNDSKLKSTVAKAVVLDRQRAEIDRELKKIKAQLINEADTRIDEHTPTEGGGSTIRFDGADGCCATVSFPARTLKSSILVSSKPFEKIMELVETNVFDRLFVHLGAYRPVDGFREEAEVLLGKDAKRLIKLCESESSPRVSFETKDGQDA